LNRTELQQLSDERIEDAKALLTANRWAGAYYLAGYALECALKSCVLAYVERTGIIFEDKKFAEKCWTHDLENLVKQADLIAERGIAIAANPQLGTNWLIVKDWSETARYRLSSQLQAEKLVDAITDSTNGVLSWVRSHW
jgi:HEPN domain-containing protein